jgi:hypothetical protein
MKYRTRWATESLNPVVVLFHIKTVLNVSYLVIVGIQPQVPLVYHACGMVSLQILKEYRCSKFTTPRCEHYNLVAVYHKDFL